MVRVAIIKYGVGNILSVKSALHELGVETRIIVGINEIEDAGFDAIILPGVGSFGRAMKFLSSWGITGERLKDSGIPTLGICLGMQLYFEESDEAPGIRGLGIFRGKVDRLPARKLPRIGWGVVEADHSELLHGIEKPIFYFVHTYAFLGDRDFVKARAKYEGFSYAAVVEAWPFYGTQFHPERSGVQGRMVLKNFLGLVKR